jgi:glutamate dehydrogenase/leucine dehydrogenase
LGRREATGRGVMICARESAGHLGFELIRHLEHISHGRL